MKTPDTVQTLFIRACKSKDPEKRVDSVYRRFYLPYNESDTNAIIASLLIEIIEEYTPIRLHNLLRELSPQAYFYNPEVEYWTKVKKILISHIRSSHKDRFGNMRAPLVFRK